MTAHALVEERQRCLDAGMNDHVTKPIDPEALFAVLKRWAKAGPGQAPAAVMRPPTEAGEIILPQIEGIDVDGGLKRVAGNKRLFLSLLEQFAARQWDAGVSIAAALESGDRALAGRLAHTTKGVAGNLGITGVQLAAEKVERAIRENDGPDASLLEQFSSTLGVFVAAIRNALGVQPLPTPAPRSRNFAPDAAAAAAARLRAMLEANDGDALDALADVEYALAGAVDRSRLDALRDDLSEFNFDGALSKLTEITQLCSLGDQTASPASAR